MTLACAHEHCADTPNHVALAAKLTSLEGTEAAIAVSSGMAAISSALLTALQPGDHLLTQVASPLFVKAFCTLQSHTL